MRNRFYEFVHAVIGPIIRIFLPFDIEGKENIPDCPVIMCANHSSGSDPVLLFLALGRKFKMRIMAKKELFDVFLVGWFVRKLGVFPVDRGNNDIKAIKTAMKSIKDGYNLLIFPEGTRVKQPSEVQAHRGAVSLAIQMGVDILPIYIDTHKKIFQKTKIIIGEVFHPVYSNKKGTPEEQQKNMDQVMSVIYSLGGVNES